MSILFLLIPLSLVLVVFGVWAFFWAVGSGQFDDLDTPAWEVLVNEQDSGLAPFAERKVSSSHKEHEEHKADSRRRT